MADQDRDPLDWNRPNPARLNDTSAIVRKGTYNYTLQTTAYEPCEPCDTPYTAENAFNRKALPMMGACGPYGAGAVLTMRSAYRSGGGRTADGNGTVPGNRGSLGTAIDQLNKSGPSRPPRK